MEPSGAHSHAWEVVSATLGKVAAGLERHVRNGVAWAADIPKRWILGPAFVLTLAALYLAASGAAGAYDRSVTMRPAVKDGSMSIRVISYVPSGLVCVRKVPPFGPGQSATCRGERFTCPTESRVIDCSCCDEFGPAPDTFRYRLQRWFATRIGIVNPFGLLVVSGLLMFVAMSVAAFAVLSVIGTFNSMGRSLVIASRARAAPLLADSPQDRRHVATPIVLVLSDLHVTVDSVFELAGSRAPVTGEDMRKRLAKLLDITAAHLGPRSSPVLLCGDLTDTGTSDEWQALRDAVAQTALGPRLKIVPGNHDVCVCVKRQHGKLRSVPMEKCAEHRERATTAIASMTGQLAFPDTVETPWGRLVLLDTNRYPSRWIMSNAVGMIGDTQLEWLRQKLESWPPAPLLVVAHHHPGMHGSIRLSWKGRVQHRFMVSLDGERVLRLLDEWSGRTGQPVAFLHGHQHALASSRYGKVRVFAMPSSTLGRDDGSGVDRRLYVGALGLDSNGWHFSVSDAEADPT